jgi:nifR3 family TIM-barrel protein
MNLGFWQKINKPVLALAPMAEVTDVAFRRIIAKYGKPDVTWTEFVSADGLALAPEVGRDKLLKSLEYSEAERPIVAQFFTSQPEHMRFAAELAVSLGFDGVDINMGCPDRSVEKQGAGAALMKNPQLAQEIIRAAKAGAGTLPVSVKIRVGYNRVELESWLPLILAEEPAVVTVHARTRKEMSKVPARWEHVKRAVEIRDKMATGTLILGNGDVENVTDAMTKIEASGADGAMLGRAIFGNPWLFASGDRPPLEERLRVLVEHANLYEELLGGYKNFNIMKKHFKAYISGFSGAQELRLKLMEADNVTEVENIIDAFCSKI